MMHLTKKIRIATVWISEERFRPVVYDLKYTLRTEVLDSLTKEQLMEQQNVSYMMVSFFINEYIHNSCIYSITDKRLVDTFMPEFDNPLIVLPQLSETILLTTIHAKLNSLITDCSIVENLELVDIADDLSYNYFNDTHEYPDLPAVKDWLGDFSFWSVPWYFRKDFSTFDNFALDQEELDKWNVEQKDLLAQMEQAYVDILTDITEEYNRSVNVPQPKKGELIQLKQKPSLKLVPKDSN